MSLTEGLLVEGARAIGAAGAADAVPAPALRRGHAPLRHRPARHPLRPRDHRDLRPDAREQGAHPRRGGRARRRGRAASSPRTASACRGASSTSWSPGCRRWARAGSPGSAPPRTAGSRRSPSSSTRASARRSASAPGCARRRAVPGRRSARRTRCRSSASCGCASARCSGTFPSGGLELPLGDRLPAARVRPEEKRDVGVHHPFTAPLDEDLDAARDRSASGSARRPTTWS